jgi:Flp pilus assembly protein TadB
MPDLTDLPACYQGTPVEMVDAMAAEMHPGLSPHEAMDQLLQTLTETRRVRIQIPEGTADRRATCFVIALLASGIARPMASA